MESIVKRVSAERKRNASNESLTFLSVMTPLFTVYGILGYVSGWSFLAHYYDFFGLSLADADIGVDGILVHALSAMQIGVGRIVIIVVLAIGVLIVWFRVSSKNNKSLSLCIGFLIFISLFVAYWESGIAGSQSAKADLSATSSLPNVTINSREGDHCVTGKLLRRKDKVYLVAGIHDCKDIANSVATGVVTSLESDSVLIDHY
jgi:hypothetical protein